MDQLNSIQDEFEPKTNMLSQFIYSNKKNDEFGSQKDESFNFPFSNKKSKRKNKISQENSMLDEEDEDHKIVERFEDEDEKIVEDFDDED